MGGSPERGHALKIAALTTVVLAGQLAIGADSPHNHSPPEKVYAQAVGPPAIVELPPNCLHVTLELICIPEPADDTTTTTEPTTTTVTLPPPPTTEAQQLQTQDTTPPAPPDPNQPWQAPDGCMDPMGPQEAKSIEEAHYCWDGLLALFGWPQSEAFSVMYCESKGNTYAANPRSTARGLMQDLDGSYDPYENVSVAYSKYQKNYWDQWVCKPH